VFSGIVLGLWLARQETPDITLQLHYSRLSNIPWVDARMAGKTIRLALDTGCSVPLAISNEAAKSLGIDVTKAPDGDLEGLQTKVVSTPAFSIDGAPTAAQFDPYAHTYAIDLSGMMVDGKPLDGILGWPMLSMLKTEFDYGAKKVVFHRNPLDPAWVAKAKPLGYREQDHRVLVSLTLPGGVAYMAFDTGRGLSEISPADRPRLKEGGSRYWTSPDLYSTGVGERAYTANVSLAGYDLGPAAMQIRKGGSLLGNDILQCFRFVIDPDNHRFLLERKADVLHPALPGDDVFGLLPQDGKYVIHMTENIGGDYPMKTGDILLGIDGTDVSTLSIGQLANMTLGEAGTIGHLLVLRDEKKMELLYKRPSGYGFVNDPDSGKSGIAGFSFAKEKGLFVNCMKPNRPLWDAGIRPGDVITEIDGKALANLSFDELNGLVLSMRKGGVVLTVKTGDEPERKVKFDTLPG